MMFFIRKIDFAVYGVVIIIVTEVNAWRPFKIVISDIKVQTFSPKCRMNASVADSGIFNIYVEFLKPIRKPFMHTEIYLESDPGNYNMELLNRTIDLCQFYKAKTFKPLVQLILKLFDEHFTHWFKSCPVNKGVYYLKDVVLNVEKLPPFFPEKSGFFDSTVSDKNERLYHFTIFFQIVKTFNKRL